MRVLLFVVIGRTKWYHTRFFFSIINFSFFFVITLYTELLFISWLQPKDNACQIWIQIIWTHAYWIYPKKSSAFLKTKLERKKWIGSCMQLTVGSRSRSWPLCSDLVWAQMMEIYQRLIKVCTQKHNEITIMDTWSFRVSKWESRVSQTLSTPPFKQTYTNFPLTFDIHTSERETKLRVRRNAEWRRRRVCPTKERRRVPRNLLSVMIESKQ